MKSALLSDNRDVTKTRNGMRNGTSQFLWKGSFITVLLLQQHINHCSTNNSRIHRLRPPFQRFQRHDTVRAALKSCILVDSKVALLGPICLPNWTSSLAVTTLRHNKAITSLHASTPRGDFTGHANTRDKRTVFPRGGLREPHPQAVRG